MAKPKSAKQYPYVDFVVEQFAPMGDITARAMMGGHVIYCDGVVFALIAGGVLYLKTDERNRPEFERRGLQAFRPFEDNPMTMKYYQAPPEIFEDADALRFWVGGAVEAGQRSQSKKKKRSAKNV